MSRKHHVKKRRSPGGYARRLLKRGLTRTPEMSTLEELRRKQGYRG